MFKLMTTSVLTQGFRDRTTGRLKTLTSLTRNVCTQGLRKKRKDHINSLIALVVFIASYCSFPWIIKFKKMKRSNPDFDIPEVLKAPVNKT